MTNRDVDPEDVKGRVLWHKGTEEPYTGKYHDFEKDGVYLCGGCGSVLFDSEHKFDSGSGWPSFDRPAATNSLQEVEDRSHDMVRTEVTCTRCGGHLGHVFDDGPSITGQRYCINSAALDFEER